MKNGVFRVAVICLFLGGCMQSLPDYKNPVSVEPISEKIMNKLRSDKQMGLSYEKKTFAMRVFAPRATQVIIEIFDKHDDVKGERFYMHRDADGVWEYKSREDLWGKYYGYYVYGNESPDEGFRPNVLIADPYSEAVLSQNHYTHPAKTIIIKDDFDWEGDSWLTPDDPRDLIIYETHIRDMTIHPSARVEQAGTYLGLTEEGKPGGMNYLRNLGVNAVQFLPLHDFANIEIPYKKEADGFYNTWNPYERNHWGYMTSYFFAPESYYASGGTMEPGAYNGIYGQQLREMKTMVKSLHEAGIAVILDVVYNHVSQYDYNPFKLIDKKYYFHLDTAWNYLSVSGCGNDFRTEQLMARKMIIESIKHWMTEYHIDGFRFDLAAMIDEETLAEIQREAQKINPNVILIAEPWGGGYKPARFSEMGYAAWNDQFRNGIKGQNPDSRPGFIFSRYDEGVDRKNAYRFFLGTLVKDGGLFKNSAHSVNYLESHDDHTFGDFVRLALKGVHHNTVISDLNQHIKLSPNALNISKLGAFILASSQGIMMIHSGQEYARSKVIAKTDAPDPNQGKIDHNSYNKDNETNYINYEHIHLNKALYDYYVSLIHFRHAFPELRKADREFLKVLSSENCTLGMGYQVLPHANMREIIVLVNGCNEKTSLFLLPEGRWDIYADHSRASLTPISKGILGQITLPPISGMVLMRHGS
ncbi:MAG TPA: pullulanase [Candidatus Marinimicrobia bacterium]|nr:pullulanase [Candidatus Neomarinimicrobiota bacterium]